MTLSYFRAISCVLILVSFFACSQKVEPPEKENPLDSRKEYRDKILAELTDKYSLEYSLDTIYYSYSVEFDEILRAKYQLLKNFEIKDIYRNDSASYVRVQTIIPDLNLNLKISDIVQEKLLSLKNSQYITTDAAMVIDLHEIKKVDIIFNSYPEVDDNCVIEAENSDGFIGKGEVIEVQILNPQ